MEQEKGVKIPLMYESIGNRSFRGRCPTSPSTSSTTYLVLRQGTGTADHLLFFCFVCFIVVNKLSSSISLSF